MSKTLSFRQHAIKVSKETIWESFLCHILDQTQSKFIEKYFKPTNEEAKEYNMGSLAWLSQLRDSEVNNNQFRVMVLLFAEQLWRDENR